MTDVDRMVGWLREAMDAAEEAARKASELCGCHPPAPAWAFGDETTDGRIAVIDDPHPGLKRKVGRRWNGSYEGLFMAEHIVRHDPAAVLRRISADRKTLDLHAAVIVEYIDEPSTLACRTCGSHFEYPNPWPCTTLRLLAEGYGWSGGG